MSAPQSAAFKKAVDDSKKLTSKPGHDYLLTLYGLYKVGTGEDITKVPEPGLFDLKNKAKKKAWEDLVNDGVTAEQAQEKYVAHVEKMKKTYGYDENKQPEAVGS